jgi:hypothetical protein
MRPALAAFRVSRKHHDTGTPGNVKPETKPIRIEVLQHRNASSSRRTTTGTYTAHSTAPGTSTRRYTARHAQDSTACTTGTHSTQSSTAPRGAQHHRHIETTGIEASSTHTPRRSSTSSTADTDTGDLEPRGSSRGPSRTPRRLTPSRAARPVGYTSAWFGTGWGFGGGCFRAMSSDLGHFLPFLV